MVLHHIPITNSISIEVRGKQGVVQDIACLYFIQSCLLAKPEDGIPAWRKRVIMAGIIVDTCNQMRPYVPCLLLLGWHRNTTIILVLHSAFSSIRLSERGHTAVRSVTEHLLHILSFFFSGSLIRSFQSFTSKSSRLSLYFGCLV